MRLTDASVVIRPRRQWEAIDLGILIARRHSLLLISSWALVSLPVFALISALLWQSPGWAALIFWWLKPAFDRLPLYILSRALFGDPPTLRASLKAFPGLLRPQLLASLTWRRFSPIRSFSLPVLLLEHLNGRERSERVAVLARGSTNAAVWLTFIGIAIELTLLFGTLALVYLMLPQAWLENLDWQRLIGQAQAQSLWLEHISNLLYALVLMVWEPIYVACGFTLYLNRRTTLEAWDIELAFRNLRRRLASVAPILLLCMAAFLLPAPSVWASAPDTAPEQHQPPDTEALLEPLDPKTDRLLKQPLSSSAAQTAIQAVLQAPPFTHQETVTRWRLRQTSGDSETTSEFSKWLAEFLRGLQKSGAATENTLQGLLTTLKVLLWALAIGLLIAVFWRYRDWLRVFGIRISRPTPMQRRAPEQLFGLQVTPQSLPEDVASAAEQLWLQDPRAALSLLYRALLSHLLHDFNTPIKAAHTEGEVLYLTRQLQHEGLTALAEQITQHWQQLAYGQQLPSLQNLQQLCSQWRKQFASGAKV